MEGFLQNLAYAYIDEILVGIVIRKSSQIYNRAMDLDSILDFRLGLFCVNFVQIYNRVTDLDSCQILYPLNIVRII